MTAAPVAAQASPMDGLTPADVRRVERWVRRLAGPFGDTEDLVQDVLIAAWRAQGRFRGEASLHTWLFRITENVVRQRRRTEGRFRKWLRRLAGQPESLLHESPVGPGDDLERRQKVALLYRGLDQLSDTYRTPLILFEIEGLDAEAIGVLLGCTANSVRVRLHRGRSRLFEILSTMTDDQRGGQ